MKKIVFPLLFWLVSAPLFAQLPEIKPVDYAAIEKTIADPLSSYHYPTLLKRYMAGDTLLDTDEFRHLYFGYTFQDNFSPYGETPQLGLIRKIVEQKEELTQKDYAEMIRLAKDGLVEKPFSINLLNYLVVGYRKTNDMENYARWRHNLFGVIDAILSSGDGKTMATAYHVAEVSDEYTVLNLLDFEFGGEQSLQSSGRDSYDYLTVKANDAKIEGLYFNITRVFGSLGKMFDKGSAKKKKKNK